jgi:uncharacterized phage protein (TIGR01671 family)
MVWYKTESRWLETPDGLFFKYPHSTMGEYFGDFIHDPYYPQQFTGLLDKNNKEIYEGHILKVKSYDGWFDKEGFYYNSCVFYDAAQAKFVHAHKPELLYGSDFSLPHLASKSDNQNPYEIIGNIFENPELLSHHTPD